MLLLWLPLQFFPSGSPLQVTKLTHKWQQLLHVHARLSQLSWQRTLSYLSMLFWLLIKNLLKLWLEAQVCYSSWTWHHQTWSFLGRNVWVLILNLLVHHLLPLLLYCQILRARRVFWLYVKQPYPLRAWVQRWLNFLGHYLGLWRPRNLTSLIRGHLVELISKRRSGKVGIFIINWVLWKTYEIRKEILKLEGLVWWAKVFFIGS